MATFLLAWIVNCAVTEDLPAPSERPPDGGGDGAVIVTVGVAYAVDEEVGFALPVAVPVIRVSVGSGGDALPAWGLNVPTNECCPSDARSPFTLTSVRL